MIRIGTGYDVHRLVEGRQLILGGVPVEHHLGLKGHSDADVLLHALIDAMLGAAALGDIGCHFPPGDQRFLNISSLLLLEEARKMLAEKQFRLVNADMTVIAQAPMLAPYTGKMQAVIANALGVSKNRISVKATTTEGLGACGREEGICAQAVVLIESISPPAPSGREAL